MTSKLAPLIATALLLLLLPVIALIFLVILIREGAPVFFVQERVGLSGRPFKILKFRTMANIQNVAGLNTPHQHAVTKTGETLRWLKLDELPQLINILKGEMAFFGPRPELEHYVKDWPSKERGIIQSVLPGLIDPAIIQLVDEEAILAASSDADQLYRTKITPFKHSIYIGFIRNPNVIRRNTTLSMKLIRFMFARLSGRIKRSTISF
jgi:lipopolysaccharide/colanic/teichoic acid biosynthesis glycosyltransferase